MRLLVPTVYLGVGGLNPAVVNLGPGVHLVSLGDKYRQMSPAGRDHVHVGAIGEEMVILPAQFVVRVRPVALLVHSKAMVAGYQGRVGPVSVRMQGETI